MVTASHGATFCVLLPRWWQPSPWFSTDSRYPSIVGILGGDMLLYIYIYVYTCRWICIYLHACVYFLFVWNVCIYVHIYDMRLCRSTASSLSQAGITAKVNARGRVAPLLFKLAYYYKERNYLEGKSSPGWDALLFRYSKASIGSIHGIGIYWHACKSNICMCI